MLCLKETAFVHPCLRKFYENYKEFMSDQTILDLSQQASGEALDLGQYAQRAYLEYALSVVRAVPCPMSAMA